MQEWKDFEALPPGGKSAETAKGLLTSGVLKSQLLQKQERHVEASRAYSALAEGPCPVAAAQEGCSLEETQQRTLEEKMRSLEIALQCARLADADGSSKQLGSDYKRKLEENQQLAQVQLKFVKELQPCMEQARMELARMEQEAQNQPGCSAKHALIALMKERHAKVCSELVDLNSLLQWAWEWEMWESALAIFDFARPHKEYPAQVAIALKMILLQNRPKEIPPFEDCLKQAKQIRKLYPNSYIFQLDTVCALLEEQQLKQRRSVSDDIDRVPSILAGKGRTVEIQPAEIQPAPVPWEELYRCYGNPHSCGLKMRELWSADGETYRHLLSSLKALLKGWLKPTPSMAREQRMEIAAVHRQLGVVSDLDRIISEVEDPQLRTDFKELRQEVTQLQLI
uniref:Uncharacterized protein n=1 Tax=Haptolina ericina TaxID=156174 RepID=A0A7S3B8C9_9EUKA